MIFNLRHPANADFGVDEVNSWSGRDLHNFKWLMDSEIGELPPEWNFLPGKTVLEEVEEVDIEARSISTWVPKPKMIHFTEGGPWFPGWGLKDVYDSMWLKEKEIMNT